MTKALVALTLLALAAYGAIELRPLLAGPGLTLAEPRAYASATGGLVTIKGRAPRAVLLTLDGAPLLATADGRFEETLAFPAGGSILTVTATDRFGTSASRTRTIYVP